MKTKKFPIVFITSLLGFLISTTAVAATFTVTSTDDSGPGTLNKY